MSHTNHRRGDVKKRYWLGQSRGPRFIVGGNVRMTMEGERISAYATAGTECSRTIAYSRKGAKKFVNSRTRFRDRMALGPLSNPALTACR